jgi:putative cell wall-binding protein
LKSSKGIVCRECRGLNKPDSRYCWFCGAPLPRLGRGPSGNRTVLGICLQVFKWLIAAAVVAALVGGIYYAFDRVMLPILREGETTTTTVVARSTTSTRPTSTTTTTEPRDDRLVSAGTDRYATAIAISELGFPDGAPALVLVGGEDFAKAVAGGPLAAAYAGPLLLIPAEGIREDLAGEIERLDPSRVFLVGVSKPRSVTAQLQEILEKPEVTSVAGDDAFETAALVAREIKAKLETVSKVVIVPADSYIEAIAVAPLAAVKGWPILLVDADGELPRATRNVITDLEVDAALVVGTTAELTLAYVERQVGASGYETAALVAQYAAAQGLEFTHTAIATGDSFPDGLVVGPCLAADNGMLLLATNGRLNAAMLSLFTENRKAIRTLDIIALPQLARELAVPSSTPGSSTTGTTRGSTTTTGIND